MPETFPAFSFPQAVQTALTEGITALTNIETRIKADSGNINHQGIGIDAIHDTYMSYARGEVGMETAAQAMAESIKTVMNTQALMKAETAGLTNALTEIVGDAGLAEAYVSSAIDGQAESGYNQNNTYGGLNLNDNEKAKLDSWEYRPDDALYRTYRKVFDNPRYFDQKTGEAIYPGMRGDKNTNGFVNGKSDPDVMKKDKVYIRYGSNGDAQFFTEMGTPYEQLALPPGSDSKPLVEITVIKDIPCSSGEIVAWFDQPGGGKQYFTNVLIEDDLGNMYEATMENLEKYDYIKIRVIN